MAVTAAQAREIVRDNDVWDALRDAIWAALVRRAMTQARQWQRVAIWIALPGLRAIVSRLHRVWRTDLDDLRSEVVLGFIEALRQADWTGLRTTATAITRYHAIPWRMTSKDYRTALEAGDSEPLKGPPAPSPWEPHLAELMTHHRQAIMEERLIPVLLDDLASE
jgi:hypothetical protein